MSAALVYQRNTVDERATHPFFLPLFCDAKTIQEDYRASPLVHVKNLENIQNLLVENAKRAMDAFQEGRLEAFDAIVGEDSCHLRACFVLISYLDRQLQEEARRISKILAQTMVSKEEKPIPFALLYLCRAHLLTIGKHFSTRPDGSQVFGIREEDIARNLHMKRELSSPLQKVIPVAREQISRDSESIIFSLDPTFALKPLKVETKHEKTGKVSFTFTVYPAYYTFKLVLDVLERQKIPIMLSEYQGSKRRYYLLPSQLIPEPKGPVFTIEYFPTENLEKIGEKFREICLTNGAKQPQYSAQSDFSNLSETLQREIKEMKNKELLFIIAHTYATVIKGDAAASSSS